MANGTSRPPINRESINFQFDTLRLCFLRCWQGDVQDAIVKTSHDLSLIDRVGEREAAVERTVA